MKPSLITKPQSETETAWSRSESTSRPSRATSKKKSRLGANKKSTPLTKLSSRLVYSFGGGKAEGKEDQKGLLGGKGANLHGMSSLGLPVPPGFTITTEVCTYFYISDNNYPRALEAQVKQSMSKVEKILGRKFGDSGNPLLVSVRSGAKFSMPGMMDTILNLGLNDQTVQGLAKNANNPRFAYDSYRRFIAMYSDVVLNIHASQFEAALEDLKNSRKIELDTELTAEDLKQLVGKFKTIVRAAGKEFPEDPWQQLWGAIGAVFGSWMSQRAITYRKLNEIPDDLGTAVNVQAMVFGNMGEDCATGVAFTRDPSTGERKFFGEYLINAQGEDVVAGVRTPQPVNLASKGEHQEASSTLEKKMPKVYQELERYYQKLEKHHRDMQDIEFTVERGRLFMLQTRNGKRTATAAVRIAVEMVKEGLIKKDEAILRVKPEQLDQLLHPMLDPAAKKEVIAKGLPASPGAAAGEVVFDPDTAEKWANENGKKVILVRLETSPEDIHGMSVAQGILTARGGMTSHAAVVARGMGKCCVSGCSALKINYDKREMTVGNLTIREGELITLDGTSGEIIRGSVPTIQPTMNKDFKTLMGWVDEIRTLGVRTNADTPLDSRVAREFGAEGIGLCRTEHMFFEADRIDAVREMILADTEEGRQRALSKIFPMQKSDFKGIFEAMKGLPVTIRLLDPPLHEFIPHTADEIQALAQRLGVPAERLQRKAELLKEFNPMLGHRGVRLGVSFPEIYRMQVRAIMEAACEVALDLGCPVEPEIMIPLVGDWRELKFARGYSVEEADRVLSDFGARIGGKKVKVHYKIGTMIELPRAALTSEEIARHAEFFSFGTNDLTQTTYGLSRDDSGMFLKDYLDRKIYEKDPFASLDPIGVGRLMKMSIEEGRKTNPSLKVGICGEHGGDPSSIHVCQKLGLNYVSCSPYRVPIARLAAAHAAIEQKVKPKRKR